MMCVRYLLLTNVRTLPTSTIVDTDITINNTRTHTFHQDPSSQLQQLRARATRLLFSDRLNFLLALCHSSLAGEGAIELATFIADLLLDCDPTMARKFVQRVVRTKERIFGRHWVLMWTPLL